MNRLSPVFLLLLALAAGAAAVPPTVSCAPAGECFLQTLGGTTVVKPGDVVSFGLTIACNDTKAHPVTDWPLFESAAISAPTAVVIHEPTANGTRSVFGTATDNCTAVSYNLTLRLETGAEIDMTVRVNGMQRVVRLSAMSCFACASGACCHGGEAWIAKKPVLEHACDTSKCCCPKDLELTQDQDGAFLTLDGVWEGHSCDGQYQPVRARVPMPPQGQNEVKFTSNHNGDLTARLGTDGTVRIAPATMTGGRCGGHHSGGWGVILGVTLGVAVVLGAAAYVVIARRRRQNSEPQAGALLQSEHGAGATYY